MNKSFLSCFSQGVSSAGSSAAFSTLAILSTLVSALAQRKHRLRLGAALGLCLGISACIDTVEPPLPPPPRIVGALDANDSIIRWAAAPDGHAVAELAMNWPAIQPEISALSDSSLTVRWPALRGASGYAVHIYRTDLGPLFEGNEPGSSPALSVINRTQTLTATDTEYTFEGLNPNRAYTVGLSAINAQGDESLPWPSVSVSTGGEIPAQTVFSGELELNLVLHRSLFAVSGGISESNRLHTTQAIVPPITLELPDNLPQQFFATVSQRADTRGFSESTLLEKLDADFVYKTPELKGLRELLVTSDNEQAVVVAAENRLVGLNGDFSSATDRSVAAHTDYTDACLAMRGNRAEDCENYPLRFAYDATSDFLYYCGSGLRQGAVAMPSNQQGLGAVQCHAFRPSALPGYDFSGAGFNGDSHATLTLNQNLDLGTVAVKVTPSATVPGQFDAIEAHGLAAGLYFPYRTGSSGVGRDLSPFIVRSELNETNDGQTISDVLLQPSATGEGGPRWLNLPVVPRDSFFVDDFTYHLYTNVINNGRFERVESRVARHCSNDAGPSDSEGNYLHSWTDARVYCEIEVPPGFENIGQSDMQFNYLADITRPSTMDGRVLGAFTNTGFSELSGDTAICLYNFNDSRRHGGSGLNLGLFDVFYEDFVSRIDGSERQNTLTCEPGSKRNAANAQNITTIIHDVRQLGENPLFILRGEQVSAMVQMADDPTRILVGTRSGKIIELKLQDASCLLAQGCRVSSQHKQLIEVARYQLTHQPIKSIAVTVANPDVVYAISDNEVLGLTLR